MLRNTIDRRKKYYWLVLIIISFLLGACSGTPNVNWELTITGGVGNPTTFTFSELADMEQVELTDVLMEKSRGEDETRSFSGVPLEELLKIAVSPENFSTITAIAADGYAIEITKDEVVDGIIALKQNGEWIEKVDQKEGPIRLVLPTTPANRWVFQITEITVNE